MRVRQASSAKSDTPQPADDDGHSDEAADDDGANAAGNLGALHAAGFDFNSLDPNAIRYAINH